VGNKLALKMLGLMSNSLSTRHKFLQVPVESKDKAYLVDIEDVDTPLELVELCTSEQADAGSVSRFPN
jgi:hypothetical protein